MEHQDNVQGNRSLVNSDRKKLEAAITSMEKSAKTWGSTANNDTEAKKMRMRLAEDALNYAASNAKQSHQQGMADFNKALSALRSASSTAGMKQALEAVNRES